MLRTIFGPLLQEFLARYPNVRVEIESYCSDWNREPSDDVDVFFKVRAPKDSRRRVRHFPGVARGLFASADYLAAHKAPVTPEELRLHSCVGSGAWTLMRGRHVATPAVPFRVVASDPYLHLDLALQGTGIAILPLYMVRWPGNQKRLVPVLRGWLPEPITLCALLSGPARLSPRVQLLMDFLSGIVGTDRDPRVRGIDAKGIFTPPFEAGKSGV